jgi:hypothetical protein
MFLVQGVLSQGVEDGAMRVELNYPAKFYIHFSVARNHTVQGVGRVVSWFQGLCAELPRFGVFLSSAKEGTLTVCILQHLFSGKPFQLEKDGGDLQHACKEITGFSYLDRRLQSLFGAGSLACLPYTAQGFTGC